MDFGAGRDKPRRFQVADIYTPTWVVSTLTFFVLIYLSGIKHEMNGEAYGFPFYCIDARESSHFNGLKLLLDIVVLLVAPIVVGAIVQRAVRNLYLLLADGLHLHLSTLIIVINCIALDLWMNNIPRDQTSGCVVYGWPMRSAVYYFGAPDRNCDIGCEFINILTAVLIALCAAFICEWRIYRKRVCSGKDFVPPVIPQSADNPGTHA